MITLFFSPHWSVMLWMASEGGRLLLAGNHNHESAVLNYRVMTTSLVLVYIRGNSPDLHYLALGSRIL